MDFGFHWVFFVIFGFKKSKVGFSPYKPLIIKLQCALKSIVLHKKN
jgi:hypothetical protein